MGAGRPGPGEPEGSPSGGRGKPGPVGPVLGDGERPMGSGGGGRGRGGVAAPPPRSRRPHGAQLPSAPGLCGTSRTESPSACPAPPHSSSSRPRPPQLRDLPPPPPAHVLSPHPRLGPALGPLRSVRRGRSYQDHPPQQSCPQAGGVAWSRFWVQGHHFSPPPGCLCAVVLPPSPSGLVHSLPLLGRPPSTRRSSFPRHLIAGKGPNFLFSSLATYVAF